MAPAGYVEFKEAGNNYFKDKQWKSAIEEYDKGLALESHGELPTDQKGLLLSNRSQCWLNLGEWQRASEDADGCLKLLPEHTKSLFRRATASEKLGKDTDALADYVKVAKADPKNKDAIAAASRLRESVLKRGAQRHEEVLPANLLQELRNTDAPQSPEALEKKVDACRKLRALCVHKGLTATLVRSNALETLVDMAKQAEPTDLQEAALETIFVMASGAEADDEGKPVEMVPGEGPLPVPAAAADVRKRLPELLQPLATLRSACRGHAKSTARFALIIGLVFEPENLEALEALHDALAFVEGGDVNVARSGVLGLTSMLDTRYRLGRMGKPLVTSVPLLKCVETALNLTAGCDEPLKGLMPRVFALLADKDRPKEQEVEVGAVSLKMLEPFLSSEDVALRANGLVALEALFAADDKAANEVLHGGPSPLSAILGALTARQPGPDGQKAQEHAAGCLLLAGRNLKTRESLISGGGIEMILGALQDGQECSSGLLRAKLINVLAILAGHSKEVREEIFDRLDFLMELRFALETGRTHLQKSSTTKEEARRFARSLYESCVCLSIHGEFKQELAESKKTLKSMQDLVSLEDLSKDATLAFLYSSLMYNLCRSREDKVRPKRDQFPFNELNEDDLNALEEFYEKMPAESRPAKNGEVDAGSAELATQMRSWCMLQSSGSAPAGPNQVPKSAVVASLAKCVAAGSKRAKAMAAVVFKALCENQDHRRIIATSGGLRALLSLVDVEEEKAQDAARQALAQILIVTNPTLLSYGEQLDAVRPLLDMFENKHELLQFEAAMALTNLLTVGDDLRTRAVQADAWTKSRDLVFSDNEMVQRAGLECMCNLTMAPEILERCMDGRADNDLKILVAFSLADDRPTRLAVSGALAMLANYEEIAERLVTVDNFENLLKLMLEAEGADLEHRITALLCSLYAMEKPIKKETKDDIYAALRVRAAKGLASAEAKALVKEALGM
eukprot:TRINITY_DN75020_c0_g1_i1.p1 TRINITY_DN75020_c0_g1~~TRINITY_DN75020_c0_g1_i1.p1  ORF type:complete len:969 (-),score=247.08 TRINITY_DN75020_c0_g1_i1:100-3006(-)